ncbi:MAG TPA: hypothetical protein DEW22_00180 [Clostridiales bacterium]|nr:hypothetical protein [Clostridiales bacterium]
MKTACRQSNNVISASSVCACGAASFAFIFAVRFFADCFFYLYYYFFGKVKNTQRACATAAR